MKHGTELNGALTGKNGFIFLLNDNSDKQSITPAGFCIEIMEKQAALLLQFPSNPLPWSQTHRIREPLRLEKIIWSNL